MRRNYVGEGIPLSLTVLPLPPVAKVIEDIRFSSCSHHHHPKKPLTNFLFIYFDLPVCPATQVPGSPLPAEVL
jgi:hypothetical protein